MLNKSNPSFPGTFFIDRKIFLDPDEVARTANVLMLANTVITVAPGEPFDFVGSAGLLPNLSMWFSHFRTRAEALVVGGARQFILFPGSGRLSVRCRHETVECDERYGVNIETEDDFTVCFDPGRSGPGLSIDRPTLIHRLAVLMDAPVRRRVAFDTRFDSTVNHQAAVGEFIRAVLTPAVGSAITAFPATATGLSATILDLVLHSLPHNYSEDLLRPPSQIAPKHVKRAIDYIAGEVHSALTVDDLSVACGVSIRSLQYGFRHFLDTSPADYIRNVRLERARVDMRDDPQASLTEIASRWGFANLARFNARFRSAYGETPAEYRSRQRSGPAGQP